MKIFARLATLIFSGLLLLLSGMPAQAQQKFTYNGPVITVRLSSYQPENHPVIQAVEKKWIEMVEKESNGKIKIRTYYSGTLHSAKDGFKAVANDITDFTQAFPFYQPASFHLIHALDLPFAFPNAAVTAKVAEELYPKYFKKEYEAMGVYLGNYNANSSYNLFTKKPITTLEDAKGMKVRSSGGSSTDMLKALGTVPVNIPASDTYNAYQRGLVDGVALNIPAAVAYRIPELSSYMTELRLNNLGLAWAFNRKTFDAYPPEVKRFMYNMQRRLSIMYGIGYDEEDVIWRKKFTEQGPKIIIPPPKELERWKAAVQPLWEKFMVDNEAQGRPARALIADLRALVKKYEHWTPEQLLKEATEHPVHGIIDGM